MARFKALGVVDAFRIGKDGTVVIGGSSKIGDAGAWVVIDADGRTSTISHDQFMLLYSPADDDAITYLASVAASSVKN